ncbi:hypothetical protein RI054_14g68650 [Pseudoscourfieldia marina]
MQRRTTTSQEASGSPDASPQVCPPGDDDDGQLVSADLATASAWPWWTVPVALASLLIGALLVVLSIAPSVGFHSASRTNAALAHIGAVQARADESEFLGMAGREEQKHKAELASMGVHAYQPPTPHAPLIPGALGGPPPPSAPSLPPPLPFNLRLLKCKGRKCRRKEKGNLKKLAPQRQAKAEEDERDRPRQEVLALARDSVDFNVLDKLRSLQPPPSAPPAFQPPSAPAPGLRGFATSEAVLPPPHNPPRPPKLKSPPQWPPWPPEPPIPASPPVFEPPPPPWPPGKAHYNPPPPPPICSRKRHRKGLCTYEPPPPPPPLPFTPPSPPEPPPPPDVFAAFDARDRMIALASEPPLPPSNPPRDSPPPPPIPPRTLGVAQGTKHNKSVRASAAFEKWSSEMPPLPPPHPPPSPPPSPPPPPNFPPALEDWGKWADSRGLLKPPRPPLPPLIPALPSPPPPPKEPDAPDTPPMPPLPFWFGLPELPPPAPPPDLNGYPDAPPYPPTPPPPHGPAPPHLPLQAMREKLVNDGLLIVTAPSPPPQPSPPPRPFYPRPPFAPLEAMEEYLSEIMVPPQPHLPQRPPRPPPSPPPPQLPSVPEPPAPAKPTRPPPAPGVSKNGTVHWESFLASNHTGIFVPPPSPYPPHHPRPPFPPGPPPPPPGPPAPPPPPPPPSPPPPPFPYMPESELSLKSYNNSAPDLWFYDGETAPSPPSSPPNPDLPYLPPPPPPPPPSPPPPPPPPPSPPLPDHPPKSAEQIAVEKIAEEGETAMANIKATISQHLSPPPAPQRPLKGAPPYPPSRPPPPPSPPPPPPFPPQPPPQAPRHPEILSPPPPEPLTELAQELAMREENLKRAQQSLGESSELDIERIAADHLENLGGSLDGIENPLASVKDASLHHKLRNKVRNMTMPKGIVTAADGQMLTAGAASHFDEPPPPPPPSPPPPSPPHPPVVHPQVERVEEQADLVNTVERMGMHVPLDLHKPKLSKKEQKRIALLRGEDEGYTKSFTKKSRKAFHSAMDMSGSTKASTKETELHFRG